MTVRVCRGKPPCPSPEAERRERKGYLKGGDPDDSGARVGLNPLFVQLDWEGRCGLEGANVFLGGRIS